MSLAKLQELAQLKKQISDLQETEKELRLKVVAAYGPEDGSKTTEIENGGIKKVSVTKTISYKVESKDGRLEDLYQNEMLKPNLGEYISWSAKVKVKEWKALEKTVDLERANGINVSVSQTIYSYLSPLISWDYGTPQVKLELLD